MWLKCLVIGVVLATVSTLVLSEEAKANVKESPETRAVSLKLNKTHTDSFGGFSKLLVGEAHFYYINASAIQEALLNCTLERENNKECVRSMKDSAHLILEVSQEPNPDVFMEVYMDRNGLPTERKYEFKTDTRLKDTRQISLPPLSSGANWFIWVKPSRNPGVLSTLTYKILIYESKANATSEEDSTSTIVIVATILAIAGGAAAFWKFGRSAATEAKKDDKTDGRAGFRWLREEGNDLIPLSELAARKQEISQDTEVRKTDAAKEEEAKRAAAVAAAQAAAAQPAVIVSKPKGAAVGQMAKLWEQKSSESLKTK